MLRAYVKYIFIKSSLIDVLSESRNRISGQYYIFILKLK